MKTPKSPIRILKPVRGLKAGEIVSTMSKQNARLLVLMHFAEWVSAEQEVAAEVPAPVEEQPKRRRAYKRRDMKAEETTDFQAPE